MNNIRERLIREGTIIPPVSFIFERRIGKTERKRRKQKSIKKSVK